MDMPRDEKVLAKNKFINWAIKEPGKEKEVRIDAAKLICGR